MEEPLLSAARHVHEGVNDAVLFDEILEALIARHRAVERDAAFAAYDEHPIDDPVERP